MKRSSLRRRLAERARAPGFGPDRARTLQQEVRQELLAKSPYVRRPNFTELHPDDLAVLFDAYDRRFLGGLCRRAVAPARVSFRLSLKMTRTGGSTTLYRPRKGMSQGNLEIAVSSFLLFDGFDPADPDTSVAGLRCADRLEALQRVFEHELVHFVEYVATGKSDCSAKPFQEIAKVLFGHRDFTHRLVTRRERAARQGIVVGTEVAFDFKGARLTGRVNRVTKRATVLVPDPEGVRYADGRRYAKYYVPLGAVQPAESSNGGDAEEPSGGDSGGGSVPEPAPAPEPTPSTEPESTPDPAPGGLPDAQGDLFAR